MTYTTRPRCRRGWVRIETISLDGLDAANDEQLAQLWDLQAMHEPGLSRTKVTDAEVRAGNTKTLNVRDHPQVVDDDLISLRGLTGLETLNLDYTPVQFHSNATVMVRVIAWSAK